MTRLGLGLRKISDTGGNLESKITGGLGRGLKVEVEVIVGLVLCNW